MRLFPAFDGEKSAVNGKIKHYANGAENFYSCGAMTDLGNVNGKY